MPHYGNDAKTIENKRALQLINTEIIETCNYVYIMLFSLLAFLSGS